MKYYSFIFRMFEKVRKRILDNYFKTAPSEYDERIPFFLDKITISPIFLNNQIGKIFPKIINSILSFMFYKKNRISCELAAAASITLIWLDLSPASAPAQNFRRCIFRFLVVSFKHLLFPFELNKLCERLFSLPSAGKIIMNGTLPAIPWVCNTKLFQLSPAPCAEGRSAAAALWNGSRGPSPLHSTSSFQPNISNFLCSHESFCKLLSRGLFSSENRGSGAWHGLCVMPIRDDTQ